MPITHWWARRAASAFCASGVGATRATRRLFTPTGRVGTICRDICFDNGLVMRAVRDTMVVAPPLIATKAQVDELVDLVWRCLDLTAKALAES